MNFKTTIRISSLKKWQAADPKTDQKAKSVMLDNRPYLTEKEIDEWLKRFPPPDCWPQGKYAWALKKMPINRFSSWIRRNIFAWPI